MEENKDVKGVSANAVETKRSKRDRKKVTLLSSEYLTIYDDAYNRKSSKHKTTTELTTDSTISKLSSTIKTAKSDSEKKKEATMVTEKNTVASRVHKPLATYRWIGEGRPKEGSDPGSGSRGPSNVILFDAIQVKVGNHPALIEAGDNVLLSSVDTDESDVFDRTTLNRNIFLGDGSNTNRKSTDKSKVAMNQLKPFIGKVESMWEEGVALGKRNVGAGLKKLNDLVNSKDERRKRMKILVRWYYKKDDLQTLKGTFDEISRKNILSHLGPRDLLLSETRDINEVDSILGRCHVLRRKPEPVESTFKNNSSASKGRKRSPGAFVCSYNISIAIKGKNKVTISPYNGPDEDECQPPTKRSRVNSYVDSDVDIDNGSTTLSMDNGSGSIDGIVSSNTKSDDESSLEDGMKEFRTARPPTTEGSATQKIMVGEKHQAAVPTFSIDQQTVTLFGRAVAPSLVWKPNSVTDDNLDKFIDQAGGILRGYMKERGIVMNRKVPLNIDPKHLKSKFTCREFNMDQILKLFHDKNYNINAALKAIRGSPQSYLMIWTEDDKDLYNAGFKRHFSAIRFISKDMGLTKKDKEVVDYHYRFKIPDQFRRYQDKKREQARHMLEVVENHRLGKYLSAETAQSINNSTNGSKKIHNWSRTGGGPSHAIGSTEARRLGAKDFLIALKDTVGITNYLTLVDHLKSLHLRVITIPQCREVFKSHLKEHPEMLKRFEDYLPGKFR